MKDVSVDTIKPGMTSVYTPLTPGKPVARSRGSPARKWHLSFDEWINAEWETQTSIGDTYSSQAVALVHAGAWLQTDGLSKPGRLTLPTRRARRSALAAGLFTCYGNLHAS